MSSPYKCGMEIFGVTIISYFWQIRDKISTLFLLCIYKLLNEFSDTPRDLSLSPEDTCLVSGLGVLRSPKGRSRVPGGTTPHSHFLTPPCRVKIDEVYNYLIS